MWCTETPVKSGMRTTSEREHEQQTHHVALVKRVMDSAVWLQDIPELYTAPAAAKSGGVESACTSGLFEKLLRLELVRQYQHLEVKKHG